MLCKSLRVGAFFLKKMSTGLSSGSQNDLQPSKVRNLSLPSGKLTLDTRPWRRVLFGPQKQFLPSPNPGVVPGLRAPVLPARVWPAPGTASLDRGQARLAPRMEAEAAAPGVEARGRGLTPVRVPGPGRGRVR